jgi:hypothetical protein
MSDDSTAASAAPEWPLRPWLLAGLLGLAGLLIHLVTGDSDDVPWQVAVAAFLFFGSIAAAFTLEEGRWKEPAIFSLVVGLVMAGLAWRAAPSDQYLPDEQYGFAAGVVATALALPLFQAGFLKTRLKTPYPEIYHYVWTDGISAAGALAFTGISWIVLALMANLFQLLKIDFLMDLMDEGSFGWTFSGLAAGAALGTIRNQLKILTVMQTVVLLVASLLAVPLAVGLMIFLLATAISGPQVLWDATRNATPLLLACAAGAFVLANAIARQGDEAMTRNRVMRIAGWTLAAVILPLAVFAAVSMGLRLDQYGLSPARMWGFVAIVVAVTCGVIYWIALIRGRKAGWATNVRRSTFHFGLFVCAVALVLALPIVNFSGISASNQVARLQSGAVPVEEFDFAALRWDFGDSGRRALRRLQRSGNAKVVELATAALAQTERIYGSFEPTVRAQADFNLRVQPNDPELRQLVLAYLAGNPWQCNERCVALDLGPEEQFGGRRVAIVQGGGYEVVVLKPGQAAAMLPEVAAPAVTMEDSSTVEIREVPKRYVFIDGKPVGPPLEEPTAPLEGQPAAR